MFWASSMPAAVQRSAISALRQRLTLRLTGENSGNSCRDGLADELGQRGDVRCAGDVEVVAGMVPEADADLGAGLQHHGSCGRPRTWLRWRFCAGWRDSSQQYTR